MQSTKAIQQEIFDTVAVHLLTQNKHSMAANEKTCRYYADSGLKCAIGCLIPAKKYSLAFEGMGIDRIGVITMLPKKYQKVSIYFLAGLQDIHDLQRPAGWNTALLEFAALNNLSATSVINFKGK